MTNQTQTDRLAEVLDCEERAETVQSLLNHAGERRRKGWLTSANNLAAAADIIKVDGVAIQSLSTDLANAEARVKELFAANAMNLKRAHAAEARLKQLDQVKSSISPSALNTGKESA